MLIIRPMAKVLTREQVQKMFADFVETSGNQSKAAKAIGVSAAYFGEVLNGTREPGPSILEFFGIQRETIYKIK